MTAQKVARSSAARQARLDRIRLLAAEGASIMQIAHAVGITPNNCRKIVASHTIDVPAERVMRNTRHLCSTRILEQTVRDAEGATADVRLVDFEELNPAQVPDWIARLDEARRNIATLIQQLRLIRRRVYAGRDYTHETTATVLQDLPSSVGADASAPSVGGST